MTVSQSGCGWGIFFSFLISYLLDTVRICAISYFSLNRLFRKEMLSSFYHVSFYHVLLTATRGKCY